MKSKIMSTLTNLRKDALESAALNLSITYHYDDYKPARTVVRSIIDDIVGSEIGSDEDADIHASNRSKRDAELVVMYKHCTSMRPIVSILKTHRELMSGVLYLCKYANILVVCDGIDAVDLNDEEKIINEVAFSILLLCFVYDLEHHDFRGFLGD